MHSRYHCLILLILLINNLSALPHKKVAVVLSGGGAKGVAHVGALKVIEDVGLPVDYIVGTSIGAIVGGLYATGYTPQQLDSIVRHNDWISLITDNVERDKIPFPFKNEDEKFMFSIPLDKKASSQGGLLEGRSISNLLHELTKEINDSVSFDSLPVSFACVATNMVTNRKEVLRSGSLVEAMRASMGIPLVFTPVRKDGKVLIDGGFKDNLAIEVAKDMGADYIIAIDAQSDLANEEHLQSLPDMLNQLMLMICQSELEEKLKEIDVYIKVDVTGYTAASFDREALNTLIDRGEEAAKAQIKALELIKGQISFNPLSNRDLKPKQKLSKEYPVSPFPAVEKKLKIGLRFDSEYIAALLINANLRNKGGTGFDFTVRAGKQSHVQTNYVIQMPKKQSFSINNMISYHDIFLYERGNKKYNPAFINETFGVSYGKSIAHNIQYRTGMNIDYHRLVNLMPQEQSLLKQHSVYLRYYNQIEYESLNSLYYPTKGSKIKLEYNLFKSLKSFPSFYTFGFHAQKVFRLTRETTVIPMLSSRFVSKKNVPFVYANMMGGIRQGRYFSHQLPFAGINHAEVGNSFLTITQINVNRKIAEKHYLKFIGSFGVNCNRISNLFNEEKLYGCDIGYGYKSPIGPVELHLNYSNRTGGLGWFLNIGFHF